jgi:hypothetical protein
MAQELEACLTVLKDKQDLRVLIVTVKARPSGPAPT